MNIKKKPTRLGKAIVEMAEDQFCAGVMDADTFEKITIRHLGEKPVMTAAPITAEQIRETREQGHLSQAAFAKYLNVTTGFVSQLERGTKTAKGPVLALLNVIRHKGIAALL
ncbi:MAG: helix-turn-helix domain-containing protein [Terriglobus sp.]